jgi:hypothetical protein
MAGPLKEALDQWDDLVNWHSTLDSRPRTPGQQEVYYGAESILPHSTSYVKIYKYRV